MCLKIYPYFYEKKVGSRPRMIIPDPTSTLVDPDLDRVESDLNRIHNTKRR
jgi:hypothetical protein